MADFPKKHLVYIPKSIAGDIDVAVSDFEDALADRRDNLNSDGIFLPNMEAASKPTTITTTSGKNTTTSIVYGARNKLIVNSDTSTELQVYKINSPGFFYCQHWKGYWNPEGYVQILVCKSSDFKTTPVYELMNTKDTSAAGTHNDHVNNMFPFRPGSSTYVALIGTLSDKIGETCDMIYVPAYEVYDAADDVDKIISLQSEKVDIPASVVSGSPIDSHFLECFE